MRDAEQRIRQLTRPSSAVIVVLMIAGAFAGAAMGTYTGPIGMLVGAVIGSAVGGFAGLAIQYEEAAVRVHDARLDRDIGVTSGDLGAGAALDHPRASMGGLYSASSAGVALPGGRTPVAGPMPE